ncbi:MAG: ABC transporter permease [Proteobacteria bacterium]|jgi:putative spermidine/putrescine transport system permease protein|nr:ABC transporter permease [Pseudomonadota bacterium]MBP11646.1 ABC transporter permease [Acidiferrobacteraceae bacterium]MCP4812177.1 ABC transporter permease [Planctomycetaceae bacterium]MDP6135159.1 ABC transporter permease [Arenicellales bacterium]HJP10355.1 ABC transporter permease [Arenicellales bacterium]|tara:strand:+ start:2377 stop:3366 length:990 start_codon:yes stop_codon:yes gene_type:complete
MESLTPSSHPGLVGDQPVAPECPGVEASVKRRRREGGFPVGWLIAPSALWLLVFLVIPLVSIVVFSLWTSTGYGLEPDLDFGNYAEYFLAEGFFDPDHRNFLRLSVFIRTLGSTFAYTLEVMVLCLLLGYPIAYFLAMRVSSFKWQMALFLVCMVPFWTSYLIRAVAWLPMLGRRGLLNSLLVSLGIIDKPARFLLYSEFGYTTALAQLYVVLCVGPIFFSLAKIDNDILEAARDMGATAFQIFREIILPLSLPGVAIGMIFIFVMLMGEFATAVVVYGGKASTVGTVILNYYAIANYPFAAVNAIMLMLAMMIGVVIILRLVNIRKEL